MKKIAIMALLVVASAGFSTANAQSKKEKKQKKQEQIESIAITTPVSDEPAIDITKFDSLSYAAGRVYFKSVRSIKRTASRLYTWTERRYFKT